MELPKLKKMNIIIFNKNDELLSNFYKNKNIILTNIKIKFLEKKINYNIKKSDENDWLFIEFENNINFNLMIENAFNYISDNFNNKNAQGESVIVVFLKKENNEELDIISYFENKSNLKRPRLIFVSNDKTINFYKKYIEENELNFDDKDIQILKEEEFENQLMDKLLDCYKYYYQIGDDEIILPKVDDSNIEFNLKYTVNIFVTGKPGTGKSTLINLLLNEKKARESSGKNTTNKIIKFIKKNTCLAFYDTPGFVSGNDVDETIKLLKEKVKEMDLYKEKIHGILYLLNSNLVRTMDDNEIDFIKFLLNYDIPIFFILNFSNPKKKKSQIFLKRFLEEINNSINNFHFSKYIFQVNLRKDYDGDEVYGINTLMKGLYEYYSPHKLNPDLLNNIQSEEELLNKICCSIFFNNIKKRNDILANAKFKSKIAIHSAAVLGAFIGFSTFLPFSDLPFLASVEIGLITVILAIYGIKRTTSEKKEIIKESTKSGFIVSALSTGGYFLGNALKTVPIIGQIPGGIIDASVAGIAINRIGKFTIDYCEKLFEQELFIDYIRNAINSMNSGVDELLNIGKMYQN